MRQETMHVIEHAKLAVALICAVALLMLAG